MHFYCSEKDAYELKYMMEAKCARADISRAQLIRTAIREFCDNTKPWYDMIMAEDNNKIYSISNIIKAIMKKRGINNDKKNFENDNLRDTLSYTQSFALHSVRYVDYKHTYINEHNGSWKGIYSSYQKQPQFKDASRIIWKYFKEKDGIVRCTICMKEIKDFRNHRNSDNSFTPHHERYEWELLWFPFINNEQVIFPYHNKCHKEYHKKEAKNDQKRS